ncbi:hypothetical protein LG200_07045 [Methylobacillus caricis]|uniref:hypothetical protein n=1 Tax=Methylobacillus caricis TaxID=1971611 RepID=UPI001CFFCAD8|nr:hypothetical protein [Methylobacillus caricis]MCB5187763.1 hypothetical protein [Methylobacillus caricis]
MQKYLKLSGLGLLLLGCNVASADDLPVLNARFETSQCAIPCKKPVAREWIMMRDSNQLELRDVGASHSDLWQVQADGSLDYVYVMHNEKRAIDYNPVDLRLLGISAGMEKWQALSRLVTQEELSTLEKLAGKTYQGMSTEVYRGKLDQVKTEVTWIPALQIPLQVQYHYPDRVVTVKLVQRFGQALPVEKTTYAVLQTYQHVDFTDIGDMEHDQSATAWLALAKGAPGVHVHHHASHHAHDDHEHAQN